VKVRSVPPAEEAVLCETLVIVRGERKVTLEVEAAYVTPPSTEIATDVTPSMLLEAGISHETEVGETKIAGVVWEAPNLHLSKPESTKL
jgi:hypothetical protein